jgi:hypothetical protein
MESLHAYLGNVTILDHFLAGRLTVIIGIILLLCNLVLSVLHTNQERQGKLWNYFGHVEGVKIPDALGLAVFFVGLTAVLWIVGFFAFTNLASSISVPGIALIGGIIGARLSDSFYSHLLLYKKYDKYAANPGLQSVPYYLVEAAVLLVIFFPGLVSGWPAGAGFVLGWAGFAVIRPSLRWFWPASWRQERWIPA